METVHRRLSNTQAVCVSHRWHRRGDVYQAISRVITGACGIGMEYASKQKCIRVALWPR
jgi:hypothetical protein